MNPGENKLVSFLLTAIGSANAFNNWRTQQIDPRAHAAKRDENLKGRKNIALEHKRNVRSNSETGDLLMKSPTKIKRVSSAQLHIPRFPPPPGLASPYPSKRTWLTSAFHRNRRGTNSSPEPCKEANVNIVTIQFSRNVISKCVLPRCKCTNRFHAVTLTFVRIKINLQLRNLNRTRVRVNFRAPMAYLIPISFHQFIPSINKTHSSARESSATLLQNPTPMYAVRRQHQC